jgi:hypothetical protein
MMTQRGHKPFRGNAQIYYHSVNDKQYYNLPTTSRHSGARSRPATDESLMQTLTNQHMAGLQTVFASLTSAPIYSKLKRSSSGTPSLWVWNAYTLPLPSIPVLRKRSQLKRI